MIPKLGDRVRYRNLIIRKETFRGHTWKVLEGTPGEGIFVGFRYKQTGFMDSDYEEGWSTRPNPYWSERGKRTKVALVVKDPWVDPSTVDPEGLVVLPIEGPCYVLADGSCISPFNCVHGEGMPLEDFIAHLIYEIRSRMPMSG